MNSNAPRGILLRGIVALWNTINFARRLVVNIIFFGVLLICLIGVPMLFRRVDSRATPQVVDKNTTLVIAPNGKLVEQFTNDPLSRGLSKAMHPNSDDGGEVQLRDLIQVIQAATTDPHIARIFLDLDKLQFSSYSYASLREIAEALSAFRQANKKIIAFGESFNQQQYFLASQANILTMDPMGSIELLGLENYRQFFHQALTNKLGVDMYLFRVGEYKSAAEPYILDAASVQAKQADAFWMNDIWQRYINDVAQARHITPQNLVQEINSFPEGVAASGGDISAYAIAKNWIDATMTRAQVDALVTKLAKPDPKAPHGYLAIDYGDYLDNVQLRRANQNVNAPQVAVVIASGDIRGGVQPNGAIGGESTSELLHVAQKNPKIKAVVLRVNSPGGEVFASEQIRREVMALRQAGKPVVVSMGDVAASGGYWISMNADRIFANPSTITGSIGIFGLVPNFARALDKIGIHTDGVATTSIAGAQDLTRPMDPRFSQLLQSTINKGYSDFTRNVAVARNQPLEQIQAIAQGRVWTGEQAKERGLVDAYGNMQDAIAYAAQRAKLGVKAYRVVYVEKQSSPFSQFFGYVVNNQLHAMSMQHAAVLLRLLAFLLPDTHVALPPMDETLQSFSNTTQRVTILAHCFCSLSTPAALGTAPNAQ